MTSFRFHHSGVLVPNIDLASRYYVDNFGYQINTAVIHDRRQTAYVRFLRIPGDANYLELVAPDGPESVLTKGLRRSGGLHHICLSTPALAEALQELSRNGALVISAPQPAVAFGRARIAWLLDQSHTLVELVESSPDGHVELIGS